MRPACLQQFILLAVLTLSSPVLASKTSAQPPLPEQVLVRVQQYKLMLKDVEPRPAKAIIAELVNSDHPMLNLQIKEAMAKTFTDIVREQNVEGEGKRKWLYSMVALNMANLQFGGSSGNNPLNTMILRKLKKNLPPEVLTQKGFHISLD